MSAERDVVIFRVWKGSMGSVLALFPYVDFGNGFCTGYEHIGQHAAADYRLCVQKTRAAKPSEYKELAKELRQIGYKLDIHKRASTRLRKQ